MYIEFNGESLEDVINVVSVNIGILPNRVNELYKIGNNIGANYRGHTYDPKVIDVEFNIVEESQDFTHIRRQLAKVLHVNEPSQLIFSNHPEVYWLAVPDGEQALDEYLRLGTGTLSFIVPEGFAHGEEKVYTLDSDNDTLQVINEGTVDTPITVEVEFPESDNGGLTVLTDTQVFSYGNLDESDTVNVNNKEQIVNEDMKNTNNLILSSNLLPQNVNRVANQTGAIIHEYTGGGN